MGEVTYKPLIDSMQWSFSRISTYEDCPYCWYLRYIRGCQDSDRFYATYGKFLHKLIEKYYSGYYTKEEMIEVFLSDFKREVRGRRPNATIVENYINSGVEYLESFEPFPFEMIDVEKKVEFQIGENDFIGFIDYLGRDGEDLVIVDNKSKAMKPRSNRKKPTRSDKELDSKLRQLYLYSVAIEEEYGRLPKYLCINSIRSNTFVKEPFDVDAYESTKKWATNMIDSIKQDVDFIPDPKMFTCWWICGVSEFCDYIY